MLAKLCQPAPDEGLAAALAASGSVRSAEMRPNYLGSRERGTTSPDS